MANSNGSRMKLVTGVESIINSSCNQKFTTELVSSELTKSYGTEGLKNQAGENSEQILEEKEFKENRKGGLEPKGGKPSCKSTLNTSSGDESLNRFQKSDAQKTPKKSDPSVPDKVNTSITSEKEMESDRNDASNLPLPGINPLKKKKLSGKVDKYILGCMTREKSQKMESSSDLDQSGSEKMGKDLTSHLSHDKASDVVSKVSNLKTSHSSLTDSPQYRSSEHEFNAINKNINSDLHTPASRTSSRRISPPTVILTRISTRRSNPLPTTGISNEIVEESNTGTRESSKRPFENSTEESSNSTLSNPYPKKVREVEDKTKGKNLNGTQTEGEVSAHNSERSLRKRRKPLKLREENVGPDDQSERSSKQGSLSPSELNFDQRKRRKPLKLREENIGPEDQSEQSSKQGSLSPSEVDFDQQSVTTMSDELRKGINGKHNLRKIKRKDLENLVIELFVNKVLYEHALGRQKELCERLEATLEANRRKAARFHKEIEDFKKVTQRLEAEHTARKNQLVAPLKVKRSVGIQANPTIIGKGLMHTESSGTVRVLSASSKSLSPNSENHDLNSEPSTEPSELSKSLNNVVTQAIQSDSIPTQQSTPDMTVKPTQTKVIQFVSPPSQPMSVSTTAPTSGRTQMLVVNSIRVNPCPEVTTPSSVVHCGTTRLVRTPLTPISTLITTSGESSPNRRPNTISYSRTIDLTSEVEGTKNSLTPTISTNLIAASQRDTKVDPPTNNVRQILALKSSPANQVVFVSSGNIQKTSSSVGGTITDNSLPSAAITEVKLISTETPVVQPSTDAENFGVQPITSAANPRVLPSTTAANHGVRPITFYPNHGVRPMTSAPNHRVRPMTSAYRGVRPITSANHGVRLMTSVANYGVRPMTSVANHGVRLMTSTPSHGVPPMTSVANHGVRPMTSAPNHGIPPMTSTPYHGVRPMATTTNYGVRPMTSAPNSGVLPMTSAPNSGVRPMTSAPNNGVRPMTSAPNHGIPPMTSIANHGVPPMTSVADHGVQPMTSASNHEVLLLTPVSNPGTRSAMPSPLNTVPPTTPPTVLTSISGKTPNGSFASVGMRHPAPLPKVFSQQTIGCARLPSSPILKLSHEKSSIVLSWNMVQTVDQEPVSSFQLFAYQEGKLDPAPSLWKKVGSVKALELPMACTLTQFMPGYVYHFAVRAIDARSRIGPFSKPKSIRLEKPEDCQEV